MTIAMCDLVLPPNLIIAKTFQLLVNLALCINKLNFILFNCLTIIALDTLTGVVLPAGPVARGHPNGRRASQSHILAGPVGQP